MHTIELAVLRRDAEGAGFDGKVPFGEQRGRALKGGQVNHESLARRTGESPVGVGIPAPILRETAQCPEPTGCFSNGNAGMTMEESLDVTGHVRVTMRDQTTTYKGHFVPEGVRQACLPCSCTGWPATGGGPRSNHTKRLPGSRSVTPASPSGGEPWPG